LQSTTEPCISRNDGVIVAALDGDTVGVGPTVGLDVTIPGAVETEADEGCGVSATGDDEQPAMMKAKRPEPIAMALLEIRASLQNRREAPRVIEPSRTHS